MGTSSLRRAYWGKKSTVIFRQSWRQKILALLYFGMFSLQRLLAVPPLIPLTFLLHITCSASVSCWLHDSAPHITTLTNFQKSFFWLFRPACDFFEYFPSQRLSQNLFFKSYADHHGHLLACLIFIPALWSVLLDYEFFSDSVIACVRTSSKYSRAITITAILKVKWMWLLYWNLGGLILSLRVASVFLEKSFLKAERSPAQSVTAPGYSTLSCTPWAPGTAALCRHLAPGLLVKCEGCLSLLGNRLEQEEPLQHPESCILKISLMKFFLIFPFQGGNQAYL